MSLLAKKFFRDEASACRKLEDVIWRGCPVCTHCGGLNNAGRLTGVRTKPSRKNPEGVERVDLWKCYRCRQQFTARQQTSFRGSHVPVHKLLQMVFLVGCCKKRVPALTVSKVLEIDYWPAWELTKIIREDLAGENPAMATSPSDREVAAPKRLLPIPTIKENLQ